MAGATGTVGRYVVDALQETGHDTVPIARAHGVDLNTGAGLGAALAGVDAVVDVTNRPALRASSSRRFFAGVTRTLLEAEQSAGVRHHVTLSIVGIDRVGLGYYQGKLLQEELVLGGPVPASVLRATQFHEFTPQTLGQFRGPFAVVPRMRQQPVAAREVGTALAALATGEPVGRAPDLAGPQEEYLPDLARRYLEATGERRRVVAVRLPGKVGRQLDTGGLLPVGPGPRGVQTFEQWLDGVRRTGR